MKVNGKGENLTPAPQKTLNQWSPKFVWVTTSVISKIVQNFIHIGLGVSVCACVISRPSAQSDSAIFGGFLRKATAETRAPISNANQWEPL